MISSFVNAVSVLQATKVDTAMLNITNNIAERGGGLSLEANAKLVVLKYEYGHYGDIVFGSNSLYEQVYSILFSANTANFGGAIHVDNDTNSGTCASDPKTECFFQILAHIHGLYGLLGLSELIERILSHRACTSRRVMQVFLVQLFMEDCWTDAQ